MRIPFTTYNLSIRAADPPAASARPPSGEMGFTGLDVFAGVISEEYLSALSGDTGLEVYDKMLRSDTQVRMVEAVINLPIRSAPISVQPAGDGATDREAAELIETNLLSGMTTHWDDFLREAIGAVMFGFEVFEKVWEERDGYTMLRKLAPRHQRTIEKWIFDDAGGVAGIQQQGTDANGATRDVTIPIERLVLFTWDKRKGNPEGLGLLRTMYKPWFFKEFLYKVLQIGLERFWQGIPKGKLPEGFTDEDKVTFLDILKRVRGGHDAGLVLPPGYEVEMLEGAIRSGTDIIMAAIEHYDVQIARAALAQWVNLGTTRSGSRAVADTQVEIFVSAENAVGKWFVSHANRYIIPDLCQYNWPGLKQFPQLVINDVGTFLNRAAIADGLSKLAGSSLITPDDAVEDRIRQLFDLPELPEGGRPDAPDEDPEDDGSPDPSESPSEDPSDDEPPGRSSAGSAVPQSRDRTAVAVDPPFAIRHSPFASRPPTHYEQRVPLARIRSELDSREEALAGAMREWFTDALTIMTKQLRPAIRQAAGGKTRERHRLMGRLADLVVPKLGAYRTLIQEHLQGAVDAGLAAAAESTGTAPPSSISARLRADVAQQAATLAEKHAADLLFALRSQVERDITGGLAADQVLFNLEQAARKRATLSFGESLNASADHLAMRLSELLRG